MAKKAPALFTKKSVEVEGFSIDVRSSVNDDRRAVILVHGLGVSEKYFRRLADELASHYHVIGLNLPGYGETKKTPHALDLAETANVIARFIRQENISRPIVVGHSMGCQVVARLGAMNDVEVDRLILLSPTVNHKERTAPLQFLRLMQDALREPFALNLMIFSDYIKFGLLRFLATQRYMIADEIETHLARCTQPTLIMRGERDKIVPRDWVVFLQTVLKNGSLVEVKTGPHNFQYTHPKEVASACMELIEQGKSG